MINFFSKSIALLTNKNFDEKNNWVFKGHAECGVCGSEWETLTEIKPTEPDWSHIEDEIEWIKPKKPNMFQKMLGVENETHSFINGFLEQVWSFFQAKSVGIEANL